MNLKIRQFIIYILLICFFSGCGISATSTNHQNSNKNIESSGSAIIDEQNGKESGIYGFCNTEGTYLLVLSVPYLNINKPEEINLAVGNEGDTLAIKYAGFQKHTEKDDGTEWSNNFYNLAGYLYKIEKGKAVSKNTYYLTCDKFFDINKMISIKRTGGVKTNNEIIKRLEKIKNRKVKNCWTTYKTEDNASICTVEFEREGNNILVCLAYVSEDKIIFKDYAVEYDPGVELILMQEDLPPYLFKLLFVYKENAKIMVGTEMEDYDGTLTNVMIEDNNIFKDINLGSSLYLPPL